MTETATNPIVAQPQNAVPTQPTITEDIRLRVDQIGDEMNQDMKERSEVITGAKVALVAQEHLLMLGPGGTGKTLLVRNLASHIEDSVYWETALDETTDPSSAVFGPPNIKAMVDDGRVKRVFDGQFPQATHVMLDELFNANGPLLHSLMPCLNERVVHDDGKVIPIPLRSAFAGTNKLNADADLAAMWDRVHLRYVVDYIGDRKSQIDMVDDAIARMFLNGRGTSTSLGGTKTMVTLAELDQAHLEALSLDVPAAVAETFFDIRDELKHGSAKVNISDRRTVEGMAAVKANAWINGHTSVTVGDLDVLAAMWWTVQDQMSEARSVILAATNPGEKAALDLLDGLDELKKELKEANGSDMDPSRKKKVGISSVKSADKLVNEAQGYLAKAKAAGTSTTRLEAVIKSAEAFKVEVGQDIFGINPNDMAVSQP